MSNSFPKTILLTFCLIGAVFPYSYAAEYRAQIIAGTGTAGFSGDGGAAVSAQLNNPYGLARGPKGIYICDMDNHRIRLVTDDGKISTFAGNGTRGYSGDGGTALEASLNEPYEIRFDKNRNIFFVERLNHLVRRIDANTGRISTVAGNGKAGFAGDGGSATQAMFSQPHSIQFGPDGHLYICDIANHRIRKVNMTAGTISTFSGTGEKKTSDDGAMISGASLNGPRAMDFDREGNLWLALREGNAVYQLDLKKGTLHRRAGTGKSGFTGNGGPALEATLSGPKGLSIGPDGNVYLADTESHTIRMIDVKTKTIHLVAGTGTRGTAFSTDPLKCELARPHGIFVDRDGTIFVGDSENHRVLALRPTMTK